MQFLINGIVSPESFCIMAYSSNALFYFIYCDFISIKCNSSNTCCCIPFNGFST
ncbi:Uncharacterised protein [Mycobacterium tuberculosis]|nr:Uncharacterised protein [Mycobacterium tuberculosis]